MAHFTVLQQLYDVDTVSSWKWRGSETEIPDIQKFICFVNMQYLWTRHCKMTSIFKV